MVTALAPSTLSAESALANIAEQPPELLSSAGLQTALAKNSFTQEEFLGLLVKRARSDNEKVSLGGLALLWRVTTDTAKLNGAVAKLTASRIEGGVKQTATTNRLTTRLQLENPHATPQGLAHVIPARDPVADLSPSPDSPSGDPPSG